MLIQIEILKEQRVTYEEISRSFDTSVSEAIYDLSSGCIERITRILEFSAIEAIKRGTEATTMSIIDELANNPFLN